MMSEATPVAQIHGVWTLERGLVEAAQALARQLELPWCQQAPRLPGYSLELLTCADQPVHRLQLVQTGRKTPGPVFVDFVSGQTGHRHRFGGGYGQALARAVGVKPDRTPKVLDATAGLARDGFVLASLGCEVCLLERSPVVAALVENGLQRALSAPHLGSIVHRMHLIHTDALYYLENNDGVPADVIFLDPMFPTRRKSALVKKEMKIFQDLVGKDPDSARLLELALTRARYRVVVKRPRLSDVLSDIKPSAQISGKTTRYDLYFIHR